MIGVRQFLARVEEIAAEEPGYKEGHWGKDGLCDCIGLIIGAIRRAGGSWTGIHGSNYAARNEVRELWKLTSPNLLRPGMAVFKAREPGDAKYALPSRYESSGDRRDYYHVGVVVSVSPLRIRHMTTPKPLVDTKVGKWGWFGELKKVSYGTEVVPVGTAVNYQAKVIGGTLNLRAAASTASARICGIPVSSIVTVTEETDDTWARVKYKSQEGYAMRQYIAKADGIDAGPEMVTVERSRLEDLYDELGDILGMRG